MDFLNSVVFSAILFAVTVRGSIPGGRENEICRKNGEQEWTCRPLEECKSQSITEESFAFCRNNGTKTMVCCEPQRYPRSPRRTRATTYCESQIKHCKPIKWTENSILESNLVNEGETWPTVGLRPAIPMKYPHMAAIGYGDEKHWACSGSLVSEQFVLTSAYCCHLQSLGEARWVKLGSGRASVERVVVEKFIHPGYDPPRAYHDLAVFRLDQPVQFTDGIKPLCIHTMSKVPYAEGTATGWGENGVGDYTGRLFEIESAMIQTHQCNALRRKDRRTPVGVDPEIMMCAGALQSLGGLCQGFSGSPLVIKKPNCCLYFIVGVASFGEMCNDPMSPGIYTRIYPYISWIEDIVWPTV